MQEMPKDTLQELPSPNLEAFRWKPMYVQAFNRLGVCVGVCVCVCLSVCVFLFKLELKMPATQSGGSCMMC